MSDPRFILKRAAYQRLIARARLATEDLGHSIGLFSRKALTDRWVAKCRKCKREVTVILTPVNNEQPMAGNALWEKCNE